MNLRKEQKRKLLSIKDDKMENRRQILPELEFGEQGYVEVIGAGQTE